LILSRLIREKEVDKKDGVGALKPNNQPKFNFPKIAQKLLPSQLYIICYSSGVKP